MKKRSIAMIALSVLLLSAAGCNKAADEIPDSVVSVSEVTVSDSQSQQDTEQSSNLDSEQQSSEISQQESSRSQDSQTSQQESSRSQDSQTSQQESSSSQNSQTSRQESSRLQSSQTSRQESNSSQSSQTSRQENRQETTTENSSSNSSAETSSSSTVQAQTASAEFTANSSGIIDTSDLFSKRDLLQTPDLSEATSIQVSDGQTINITEAGIYLISGSAENCTIRVETDKESKVQLVLDGVSITNNNFPAIYVVSADKCFITTTETENTLSVTGTFTSDGSTNTDAVIFSKDDIVLNGLGKLTISSSNNGISGKDDIKITGGTYAITSVKDSIEANDSIAICGGTFQITSSKDGFHSENDDDNTVGWIYIYDGTFNITASSDGIQGTTAVQIDGGTFTIKAPEGIEATYVQINGGTINITSSDDGINASKKSTLYSTPTIEFNGGYTTIVMGQGDTDAVDANGNIYVNGGTIDITAQMSSFDYDGTAEYNGGTIIINGSQVNSIPQSMMGGRGGFGGRGNMNGFGGMVR